MKAQVNEGGKGKHACVAGEEISPSVSVRSDTSSWREATKASGPATTIRCAIDRDRLATLTAVMLDWKTAPNGQIR
jgi:hypothetical protein